MEIETRQKSNVPDLSLSQETIDFLYALLPNYSGHSKISAKLADQTTPLFQEELD